MQKYVEISNCLWTMSIYKCLIAILNLNFNKFWKSVRSSLKFSMRFLIFLFGKVFVLIWCFICCVIILKCSMLLSEYSILFNLFPQERFFFLYCVKKIKILFRNFWSIIDSVFIFISHRWKKWKQGLSISEARYP